MYYSCFKLQQWLSYFCLSLHRVIHSGDTYIAQKNAKQTFFSNNFREHKKQ